MYGASGSAAEERGTLLAHDVFRYAVELPPPSFSGNDGGDEGAGHGSAGSTARRDAWWEGVRQRVPDIAVFVRSRTVASLRKAWQYRSIDAKQRRVLLAREPGGPPPVPKAYQTALECAAHVYECGSAPLTLNSARLRHQRHMCCEEYVINCAPPAAGDEVVCCSADGTWAEEQAGSDAALAAVSMAGRCFIKNENCPLAAYAAAAVAVTAPPGAPGNERVECDGGLHVRWEISRAGDGRAQTVTLYPGCKALGGGAFDCARGCPYKTAADATRRDIRHYARVTDGDVRRCVGAYRTQERADLACPACAACGVRDPRLAYSERGPIGDLPAGHWMRARADFAGRLSAVRFTLVARVRGAPGVRSLPENAAAARRGGARGG